MHFHLVFDFFKVLLVKLLITLADNTLASKTNLHYFTFSGNSCPFYFALALGILALPCLDLYYFLSSWFLFLPLTLLLLLYLFILFFCAFSPLRFSSVLVCFRSCPRASLAPYLFCVLSPLAAFDFYVYRVVQPFAITL